MGELTRARRNMRYSQAHEIGAQMRAGRKAAGLTLREMSERLEKPKSTLADAETGRVMPPLKLLEAYEQALALTPGTLVNQPASIMSIVDARTSFILHDEDDGEALEIREAPPEQPEVIDTAVRCRELTISLLLETAKDESQRPREIVLKMADPPPHLSEELRHRWYQALARALKHKDRITHIWAPPSSLKDSQLLIRNLLYLIDLAQRSGGQYTVLYLPEAFLSTVPYELFVMPNRAAVELFGKFQASYTDSAVFYPSTPRPEFVQHFRSYFAMLRVKAEPLLETYPVHGSAAFDRVILDAELRDGEENLVVEPASDKTMPSSVRLARMQRILSAINNPDTEDWLRESYAVIEQRRRRFEERVRRWAVRHILYRDVLRDMVNKQQFRDSTHDEFQEAAKLESEEIRACIHQLISDLESFPNYEVALMDARPQDDHQTYWEVVGDTSLFVFADASKSLLHVATKQKQVVQLQKNYFAHLWDSIPAADKERSQVIKFLYSLIGE